MAARRGLAVTTDRMDYSKAWDTQRRLADARRAGCVPDILWLLEHDPVFTTGRHGTRSDLFLDDAALEAAGASFVRSDRGGQMTWHGPGQTTGYVIADLRPGRRLRSFVETLLVAMREASGIDGAQVDTERMGLYVAGRKLGSVGVRVTDGITMHGLALNRDPDLGWFDAITACAAPDTPATSIAAEGGDPRRERVERDLAAGLAAGLGLALEPADLEEAIPAGAGRS